jgi:hypothetical protein
MVQQSIEMRGLRSIKDIEKKTGVSRECVRSLLKYNRIPKDNTLVKIAKGLGMDETLVMLEAHKERLRGMAADYLLEPAAGKYEKKRVWPLSQEQCEYLGRIINPGEIQLMRKYLQVSSERQIQIRGYVDYIFASHRKEPPPDKTANGDENRRGDGETTR